MFSILKSYKPLNSLPILVSSCARRTLSLSVGERQDAKRILLRNTFTEDEAERILEKIDPYLKCASQIDSSISFWRKLCRVDPNNTTDYGISMKNVFLYHEPRMLLVENDFLHERIEQLMGLDFLTGSKDLWKLFITAPAGYFMQDWSEFLRKYYYITFKILPWLEPDTKVKAQVNPLMSAPEVIELLYTIIKTRFLFVQRAGSRQLLDDDSKTILNLRNLLLTSPKEFVKIYAPNCNLEEYHSLEKLNSTDQGEEDDKLFEELVLLAPKQNRKKFFNYNVTETLVIGKRM